MREHSSEPPYSWRDAVITTVIVLCVVPFMHWVFARSLDTRAIFDNIVAGLIYAHLIGFLCSWSLRFLWPWIRPMHPWLQWPVMFLILLACATAGAALGTVVLRGIGLWSQYPFLSVYWRALQISVLMTLVFGGASVIFEVMKARLDATNLELRTKQLEHERAVKLAAEARLSSLESRVHPHFLFNALNSVSALIREDPERAERLIERLSALLRFSLDSSRTGLVPLELELKIVEDYLEIERARFGQRLRYRIDVPSSLLALEVPPLSLQTLVENSVKYAVSTRHDGASIELACRFENGRASLDVRDDGPGFDPGAIPPGHGLDLLAARLANQYGPAAALEPARLSTGGMSVRISLPANQPQLAVRA